MKTTPLVFRALASAALVALGAGSARAEGGTSGGAAGPEEEVTGPANELAAPLTVVISGERLLELGPYSQSGVSEDAGVSFTGGWIVHSESDDAQRPFYPHGVARVALDLLIGQQFSVGAAFGVGLSTGTLDNDQDHPEDEPSPHATTRVLDVRLGYVAPLGPDAAFWPRVGVSHAWASQDVKSSYSGEIVEDTYDHTALSLEAAFVLFPVPHFGILFDFTADIGLAGTVAIVQPTPGAEVVESRWISDGFGISGGFVAYF